jgi:hypothetical protein
MYESFFFDIGVFFEIMWKNSVEAVRPQMTVWRMRIACWIPKATNTHLQYIILMLFHCSSGCTSVPQCYVIRTLPGLFLLIEVLS